MIRSRKHPNQIGQNRFQLVKALTEKFRCKAAATVTIRLFSVRIFRMFGFPNLTTQSQVGNLVTLGGCFFHSTQQLKKIAQAAGLTLDLLVFVYFHSIKQILRPLSYSGPCSIRSHGWLGSARHFFQFRLDWFHFPNTLIPIGEKNYQNKSILTCVGCVNESLIASFASDPSAHGLLGSKEAGLTTAT